MAEDDAVKAARYLAHTSPVSDDRVIEGRFYWCKNNGVFYQFNREDRKMHKFTGDMTSGPEVGQGVSDHKKDCGKIDLVPIPLNL